MTFTITFPVQTFQTGDTVQLIIAFENETETSNYNANELGMKVLQWGLLKEFQL